MKINRIHPLIKDNLEELSSNFLIQKIEEKAKKDGLEIEIYIDTHDVIRIILGIYNYISLGGIDKKKFYQSRAAIVHGFIYREWLENIKILPPHQDEFILKLSEPYMFNTKLDDNKTIEDDFFQKLEFPDLRFDFGDFDKFKGYFSKLKTEATNLFKADFVLREEMSWVKRYKYLFEERKILKLDNENYVFEADECFQTILTTITSVRKSKNFLKNNHLDALALRCLQRKLEDFEKSGHTLPLPIFYCSSPHLYSALKKAIHFSVNDFKQQQKLLAYYDPNSRTYIPIIRNTDYFILDVIYNRLDTQNLSNYFKTIEDLKRTIEDGLPKVIDNFTSLEDDIKTLISTEFFEKIWLKNKGYQELNSSILSYLQFKSLPKYDEKLENLIKEEKRVLLSKIPRNRERIKNFHLIWKTLEKRLRLEEIEAFNSELIDVYKDFGLVRFSLDSFKDSNGESVVINNIRLIFNQLIEDYRYKNWASLSNKISIISSYVSGGIFNENLFPISEKYNNFLVGLTILWIFGEHQLIAKICSYFNEDYPSYHLAVIHASSLFLGNDIKKVDKGYNVLNCIEQKEIANHYKGWASLSFLYFRIWEVQVDYMEFPELIFEREQEIFTKHETCIIINKCILYIEKALNWLSNNRKREQSKEINRNHIYYYLMNNYIYYVTRGGSIEKFNKLKSWEDKLERSKATNYWQIRFYDTLAWYNFRKALISYNNKHEYKYYLILAKQQIKMALKGDGAKNIKERKLFHHIDKKISEIIITGYKGNKLSEYEINSILY